MLDSYFVLQVYLKNKGMMGDVMIMAIERDSSVYNVQNKHLRP